MRFHYQRYAISLFTRPILKFTTPQSEPSEDIMLRSRILVFTIYLICAVGVGSSLLLWRVLRHNEEVVLLNFINLENESLRKTLSVTLQEHEKELSEGTAATSGAARNERQETVFRKNAKSSLQELESGAASDSDSADLIPVNLDAHSNLGLLTSGTGMISDAAFAAGIIFTILLILTARSFGKRARDAAELREQIAARKKIEDSLLYAQQRTEKIIETAADAIITTRQDGEIVSTNSAAERLFGCGRVLVKGKKVSELFSETEQFLLLEAMADEGKPSPASLFEAQELVAKRLDGTDFPAEVSVSSGVFEGHRIRTFIVRDATERKAREQGLQNIIKALRRSEEAAVDIMEDLREERKELTRINDELKKAELKALSSSHAKSTFLANMSHEIRTPLTAIIGFTESALRLKLPPEEQHHVLKASLRNGQHLLQLIDDILCFSKIEAGKLSVEKIECHLKDILNDIENAMKLKSLEKAISFKTQCLFPLPLTMVTDPTRVKQVLYNVVANAIKFTPKGSVTVSVSFDRASQKLLFKVVDTGVGMSKEVCEHLFQAFEQGDPSTTRRYGGTGLGLVITKQLIGMLGGTIEVTSTQGVGTTVSFSVDVASVNDDQLVNDWSAIASKDRAMAEDEFAEVPLNGRVLVVDDAHDNQELLTMLLSKKGLEVVIAENGQKAIQFATASAFDLILMDMHMPIMDGYEAVRILRKSGYKNPIYAVTASAMDEALDRCMDIGCDGYLRKPFEYQDFERIIAKCFRPKTAEEITAPAIKPRKYQAKRIAKLSKAEIENGWLRRLPDRMAQLKLALSLNDFDAIRDAAHILRAAKNFGQPTVGEIASALEHAASSKDLGKTRIEAARLDDIAQEILNVTAAPRPEFLT